MKHAFFLFLFFLSIGAQAQITGKWETYDDKSGEKRCIVDIYERDGKFYGNVVHIFLKPGESNDDVCEKCPKNDARYNKRILGMEIILDLEKDGDVYSGGTILDAESGMVYGCKIWREGADLKVRGFFSFFYRTQTWKRATS